MRLQSLDERYNEKAECFLSLVLDDLLSRQLPNDQRKKLGALFSGIYLSDSTNINLPDGMRPDFRGPGGGSKAQAKIFLEYELLSGAMKNYQLADGCTSDNTLLRQSGFEKGALFMSDLGFFKKDRFQKIAKSGAFVLSRWLRSAKFYVINQQQWMSVEQLLQSTKLKQGKSKVFPIYLTKDKMEEQEVFYLHLDHLKSKAQKSKRQQLKWKYKKRGKPKSQEKSDLDQLMIRYNFYVTNLSPEQFPAGLIQQVYSLRWQIELIFKAWKKHCRIDEIHQFKATRFRIMLLAFLIAHLVFSLFKKQAQANGKNNISFQKLVGIIRKYWNKLILKLFKNQAYAFSKIARDALNSIKLYARKKHMPRLA